VIKVGIVGATGYTGVELLRLLAPRKDVSIKVITSREMQGTSVADLFPNLRGHIDLAFSAPDTEELFSCDVVFYATPHAVAMKTVPGSGGVSAGANQLEGRYALSWAQNIWDDMLEGVA